MAVVLASAAAIIVVTAGGVSMINKTRLGDIISDINKFSGAVESFRTQYGALPGDIADVSLLSGATAGNGNGAIDTAPEALNFWKDLAIAGLIKGKYDGTSTYVPDLGVPKASIKGSGYNVIIPTSSDNLPSQAIVIEIAGFSSTANNLPILKPEDAKSIDEKADDGNADTGIIRGVDGAGATCSANGVYEVSTKDLACNLRFIISANAAQKEVDDASGECIEVGATRQTPDITQVCPIGTVGKVIETCRVNSASSTDASLVGHWEITERKCVDVVCTQGSKYGDKRTVGCINTMKAPASTAGGGIRQTCTENGVWRIDSSDCAPDATISCTNGSTRAPQACDLGWTGRTLYPVCSGGTWGSYLSATTTCAAITCNSQSIGASRNSSAQCGDNYLGTVKEVCTISGNWMVTSVGSNCSPQYSGSCASGTTRDIGCSPGKTGAHIQRCVTNTQNGGSNYWTTKADTCVPITCDGGENLGATRVQEGTSCTGGRQGVVMETCTSNGANPPKGVWTTDFSNCASSCDGTLDTLGFATWNSTAGGVEATGACVSGYSFDDFATTNNTPPKRWCNADGTWNTSVSHACVRTQCPADTTAGNVFQATDAPNVDVKGSCQWPNYQGLPIKDCNAAGSWTNLRTPCVASAIPKKTGLALWLDADDFTTLYKGNTCDTLASPGDSIGCWKDKSGNGNDATQATTNARPVYKREILNGKNVLRFDGSNDYFSADQSTGTNPANTGNGAYTLLTVFKMASTTSSQTLVHFSNGTNDRETYSVASSNSAFGTSPLFYNRTDGVIGAFGAVSTNAAAPTAKIVSIVVAGNHNTAVYLNGVQETDTFNTGRIGDNNRFTIGTRFDMAGTAANGDFAEIIMYNAALSSTELSNAEDYLATKWNIQLAPRPLPVSGATLWLDASYKYSLFTDNTCATAAVTTNTIGCWRDLSVYPATNGKNAIQATAGNRPTYAANGINTKNAVDYTATTKQLTLSSALSSSASNYTFFAVINPSAVAASRYLFYSTGPGFYLMNASNTTKVAYYYGSYQGNTLASTAVPQILTFVLDSTAGATGSKIYRNGGGSDSSGISSSTSAYTQITMSGTSTVGHTYTGDIGEFIVYASALNNTDQTTIEDYLGAKWGISVSHPAAPPTPLPVSGSVFWVDASYAAGLFTDSACTTYAVENGDKIGCWKDLSSTPHNTTQATVNNQPVLTLNNLNSKNVITFDGSNDSLATAASAVTQTTDALTLFAVASDVTSAGGTHPQIVSYSDSTGTTGYSLFYKSDSLYKISTQQKRTGAWGSDYVSYGSAPVTDTYYIVSAIVSGTSQQLYVNGVGVSATGGGGNISYGTNPKLELGSKAGGQNPLNGNIAEVIVYNSAFIENNQRTIEDYLSAKWGVSVTRTAPTPPALGGPLPVFWIDGSYTPSLYTNNTCTTLVTAAAQSVGCWKDLSASPHNAIQATSTKQPTYNVNGIGTKNAVIFDGGDGLVATGAVSAASNYTIFAIIDPTNTTTVSQNYFDSQTGRFYLAHMNATASPNGKVAYYDGAEKANTALATANAQLLTFVLDSSAGGKVSRDGMPLVSGTYTASAIGGTTGIGARYDAAANYYAGAIGEILVYNSALSLANQAIVEDYLAPKWGVTINHPIVLPALPNPPTLPGGGSGPTFWVDANYQYGVFADTACSATLATLGAGAACWRDLSGNERHADQATGTKQPAYQANGIGTNTTLRFDGTSDSLDATGVTHTASNYSIFVVAKPTSTAASQYFFDSQTSVFTLMHTSSSSYGAYRYGGTVAGNSQTPQAIAQVLTYILSSTAGGKIYKNGQLWDYGTYAQTAYGTSGAVAIGSAYTGTSAYYAGDIGEILIYDRTLNTADQQAVEDSLASDWGVTVTHPTSPTVPGVFLWLDMSDSATVFSGSGCTGAVTNGGALQCVKDKSGNNYKATNSSGNPTYVTAGIGGLAVANFTGSQYLSVQDAAGSNLTRTASDYTFFVVMKENYDLESVSYNFQRYFQSSSFYLTMSTTSNLRMAYYNGSSLVGNNIRSIAGNQIITASLAAAGGKFFRNGAQLDTFAYTTKTIGTSTQIGGSLNTGLNGYIGEMLIYPTALSTANQQAVEDALGTKWGITVAHPLTLNLPTAPTLSPAATPLFWVDPSYSDGAFADQTCSSTRATTGQSFRCLRDLSGNGKNVSNPSAYLPTYKANGIGTKNTMTIPNSAGRRMEAFATINSSSSNYSIFSVVKPVDIASFRFYMDASGFSLPMANSGSGNVSYFQGSYYSSSTPATATAQVLTLIFNSSLGANGGIMFRNGTYIARGNYSASTMTKLVIGERCSTEGYSAGCGSSFYGEIGEIMIYNSALTTAQQTAVEDYLGPKWGITMTHTAAPLTINPLPSPPSLTNPTTQVPIFWIDANYNQSAFADTGCATTLTTLNGASTSNQVACMKDLTTTSHTNDLVNSGSGKPTYITVGGSLYSQPVLNFTAGSSQYLATAGNFSFGSSANMTALVVFTHFNAIASSDLLNWRTAGNVGGFAFENNGVGGLDSYFYTTGWNAASPNTGWAAGTPYILVSTIENGYIYQWRNGDLVGTAQAVGNMANTAAKLEMGRNITTSSNFSTMKIAEVLIYNSALSTANRDALVIAMSAKWGIDTATSFELLENLPATYPASPALWLDASYDGGVSKDPNCTLQNRATVNNTAVPCFKDQSGNGKNAYQTGALTTVPLLKTGLTGAGQFSAGTVTNKNALYFDGGDFLTAGTNSVAKATTGLTVFAVAAIDTSLTGYPMIASYNDTTGALGWNLYYDLTTAKPTIMSKRTAAWGSDYATFPTSPTSNYFSVITGVVSGSGTSIYVNGVAQTGSATTGNIAYNGTDTFYIGSKVTGGGSYPLKGYIAEVLVYNSALTTGAGSQQRTVEADLGTKWGITIAPLLPTPPVTGPIFWLDANSANNASPITSLYTDTACTVAATTTQGVGCAKDLSGNSKNVIQATNKPTYTANGIGSGKNSLDFNGTSSSIGIADMGQSASNYTMFLVVNPDAVGDNGLHYLLSYSPSSSGLAHSTLYHPDFFNGTSYMGTNGPASTTGAQILTWVLSSTKGVSIYRNGALLEYAYNSHSGAAGGAYPSGQPMTQTYIGSAYNGTSNFYDGDIGEVIIYNSALSAANQATVEDSLASKWGLGTLAHVPSPMPVTASAPKDPLLWLDATNSNSMYTNSACTTAATTGNSIGCWRDRANYSSYASYSVVNSGAAGTYPVYSANQFGTKPALVFTGTSSQYLSTSGNFSFTGTGITTFIVLKGYNGLGDVIEWRDGSNEGGFALEGGANYHKNTAGTWLSTSVGWSGSHYFSSRFDPALSSGTLQHWLNGSAGTAATSAGTFKNPTAPFNVARSAFGSYATVTIGEIMIYNSALTDTDRANVDLYLKAKWGL
jgi:hypothetical protein